MTFARDGRRPSLAARPDAAEPRRPPVRLPRTAPRVRPAARGAAAALCLTLGVAGAACSRKGADVVVASSINFPAKATRSGATTLSLEGAVWGTGPTAVVFAHSYPTTQDAWAPYAQAIAARGFLALTFNFRGYGQSEGFKDVASADLDLEGAIDKAKQLGARRVLVVGASMGGTATLIVASRQTLAGVVAVSAPERFRGLDATEAVKALKAPVLFVAGESDPTGAAESARRLDAAAPEPKQLEIARGTDAHGTDLVQDQRVATQIAQFLIDHRS